MCRPGEPGTKDPITDHESAPEFIFHGTSAGPFHYRILRGAAERGIQP